MENTSSTGIADGLSCGLAEQTAKSAGVSLRGWGDGELYLPHAIEQLTTRDVDGAVVGPVVQELHHLTFLELSSTA